MTPNRAAVAFVSAMESPNMPTAKSAPPMSIRGTRPWRSEALPAMSRMEIEAMTMMVLNDPLYT